MEFPELSLRGNYEPDTFKLYFADAFSKLVVKSVRAQQKFAVKSVALLRKFVAFFFAIRWYTIFAV